MILDVNLCSEGNAGCEDLQSFIGQSVPEQGDLRGVVFMLKWSSPPSAKCNLCPVPCGASPHDHYIYIALGNMFRFLWPAAERDSVVSGITGMWDVHLRI